MGRRTKTVLAGVGAGMLGLAALAASAERKDRWLATQWRALEEPVQGGVFDAAMVEGLPEPARRYFMHAIAPGTPLASHALLRMRGEIVLQEGATPFPMTAEQVLAPPRGFIWKARVGRGVVRMSGYDRYTGGTGEMRWRLYGVIPLVRSSDADVTRSAAGRLGGEALLVASTMLPQHGVTWEEVDATSARATLLVDGEAVRTTLTVDDDGRMTRAVIDRWNADPANGPVGYTPFVVEFEGEQRSGGYVLPAKLRAGWQTGAGYRPFFFAALEAAELR
jgi:hypothetical protein